MKLVVVDKPRNAYENLALNHACFDAVDKGWFEGIVRVYQFSRPGVILSHSEDVWDIRESARKKVDVTRRPTGGSVIYVDQDVVGYSVFLRTNSKTDISRVYKEFTGKVLNAVKSFGIDASIGNWYLRLDGKVVGGHAQRNSGLATEFQGIIRLKKWDMDALEKTLRLRTLASYESKNYLIIDDGIYDLDGNRRIVPVEKLQRLRDERSELASAPGLAVNPPDLMERLASCLSGSDERNELTRRIYERAKYWLGHYMNESLVNAPDCKTHSCLGHCFVDLLEKEQ